jgi:WD40 repeat protein
MEMRSKDLKERILAIHVSTSIYTGGTGKRLVNQSTGKTLCTHKKSIKAIASHGDYLCCGSYDGTATVLHRDRVLDVIEGPETEIKGVAFSGDGRFLAMATRGRSVWVCKMGEEIEIDRILEDHLHDVKGCIFRDGTLFTYSYDNTIKVYERFEYDESWEMVQSIEEESTVWCVRFMGEEMVVSTEDGVVSIYALESGWTLRRSKRVSLFPIYSICILQDRIAFILNRSSIGLLDADLDVVWSLENLHRGAINCLESYSELNAVISGGDDGVMNTVILNPAK